MSILLVKLPVDLVVINEGKFPDRDTSHVLGHLLRYCEKFDPLPAITVSVEQGTVTVVRGHKYLAVARALGRREIRAVVSSPESSADVKALLERADVTLLDWEAIKAKEEQERLPIGWHVFFFRRPLSPEEKSAFNELVRTLFFDESIDVIHEDAGPFAEFRARTPVNDVGWAVRNLAAFTSFSRERVPIVTFQGRRFGSV